MIKIRLMRIGAKKKPFYRVVVVDERAKRSSYIELLGTYNPLTEPKEIKLKQERIDHWIKQGAKLSTGYLRIIGKAPQRPPRKPKKEKKTQTPAVNPQVPEKTEEVTKTEPTISPSEGNTSLGIPTSDGGPVPSGTGDSSEVSKEKNESHLGPEESEKKDEGSA